jgi:nucleoside-diphosphate-sugar epimerase
LQLLIAVLLAAFASGAVLAGVLLLLLLVVQVAGEKLVLAANSDSLAVAALRPSGIFGEGDTVMVPTFVKQAKAGKMKYIIGNGRNVWDFTYVGNVAQAHILVSSTVAH